MLTILSPVAPALAPEGELPFDLELSEPYERQVTRTLAEGLAAMELAARNAAASGGMGGFDKRSARRVGKSVRRRGRAIGGQPRRGSGHSHRLVAHPAGDEHRAVASLPGQRPHSADPGSRTAVQGHRTSRGRGAPGFRDPLGAWPARHPGDVTLEGLVDGELRRVTVSLPERKYSQAVQAHEQRLRVACAGDLVKERGGFRLQNPRHFRVLAVEEAL